MHGTFSIHGVESIKVKKIERNEGELTGTYYSQTIRIKDSNGNKVQMAASGITVEGVQVVIKGTTVDVAGQGGEPLIKAQTFLSLFNAHTHVCTAPGSPSGPPVPPLTPVVLTTKTKAQ